MAGVKGRSGGSRPGAGRKSNAEKARLAELAAGNDRSPTPPGPAVAPAGPATGATAPADDETATELDSLGYLRKAINDPTLDAASRVRAAIALAQYEHQKLSDGGIKPARRKAAAVAGAGKFAPAAPPMRLVKG